MVFKTFQLPSIDTPAAIDTHVAMLPLSHMLSSTHVVIIDQDPSPPSTHHRLQLSLHFSCHSETFLSSWTFSTFHLPTPLNVVGQNFVALDLIVHFVALDLIVHFVALDVIVHFVLFVIVHFVALDMIVHFVALDVIVHSAVLYVIAHFVALYVVVWHVVVRYFQRRVEDALHQPRTHLASPHSRRGCKEWLHMCSLSVVNWRLWVCTLQAKSMLGVCASIYTTCCQMQALNEGLLASSHRRVGCEERPMSMRLIGSGGVLAKSIPMIGEQIMDM